MKNKKKKTLLIVFFSILGVILLFFGVLYYISSTVNNYTYNEKNWINSNSNKSIDIYVDPTLPVFASGGKGVYYDYLSALKEDTGLTINVITEDKSKYKLINKNKVDDDDVVFYRDHFVVLGSNSTINKLDDLDNKKIGIISRDKSSVQYYLTEHKNINITTFETFDELVSAYDTKAINYIVVPMYKYLNEIISSNRYSILFHLDGLFSYYCIDLSEDGNENLNGILTKFYNRYSKKANSLINKYFLEIYYDIKKYTELQKESITNDDFIVGYIDNLPFEGEIASKFTGVTDTYLSKFSTMTGVTYKYIGYKDTKELSKALEGKKIDLALNYYSISNDNYINTRTLGPSEYVVLAHASNNIVINSLYSLVDSNVSMLNNMNLKYNMASKNLFEITDYTSVKNLLKNIDENSIIIVEKEVYDYYKDSSLRKYSIRYYDTIKLNNTFLLNKENSAFNNLFDFYLSTLSSNEVKNESVVGVIATLKSNRILDFIITNLLFIVIGIFVVCFVIYIGIKRHMNSKRIKKEDRLYYFDAMTNLKNRNYLNDNIDFWSSTKVYPQAIVVIDINKLKVLNDRVGHEAGDAQIKAVASVLIKTQRDNSEIMRTDGDEFIVYLVGYDEKKIGTYIHKLNREFASDLPNKEYGVSIGYKMITSEEMTIDDAINDSLNMINKSKKGIE